MQTITIIGLVVPESLAFKLLKEISQGNVACKPRGFIGAEPSSFEQHTHRVAPANNSPAPRRRVRQIADRPDVIAPIISLANHGRQLRSLVKNPSKGLHGIARITLRKPCHRGIA